MDTDLTDLDRLVAAVVERLTSQPGGLVQAAPSSLEEQVLDKLTYQVACRLAERMRPAYLFDEAGSGATATSPSVAHADADPELLSLAERLLGDAPGFAATPLDIEPIEI